jgi:hypothetical protein
VAEAEPDAEPEGEPEAVAAGEPDAPVLGLVEPLAAAEAEAVATGEAAAAGEAVFGPKLAKASTAGSTWAVVSTLPATAKANEAGAKPPTGSITELTRAAGWPTPPIATAPLTGITMPPGSAAPVASVKAALAPLIVTLCSVSGTAPVLLMFSVTFAGPVWLLVWPALTTTLIAFSLRFGPIEVAGLFGLTCVLSELVPAAQADSETAARARTMAAVPPRRRLRLTAAASP